MKKTNEMKNNLSVQILELRIALIGWPEFPIWGLSRAANTQICPSIGVTKLGHESMFWIIPSKVNLLGTDFKSLDFQLQLRINHVKTHPNFLNTTSVVRKQVYESGLFGVTRGVIQIVFEKQIVPVISILFILRITFTCGCLSYILLNFHCKYKIDKYKDIFSQQCYFIHEILTNEDKEKMIF